MKNSKKLFLAIAFTAVGFTQVSHANYVEQCNQETVERARIQADQAALETYESMLNTRTLMTPKHFIDEAYDKVKYSALKPVKDELKAKMNELKLIKKDLKKLRSTSEQANAEYQIARQNYKTAKANYEVFKSGPYQNLKKEWLRTIKADAQQE